MAHTFQPSCPVPGSNPIERTINTADLGAWQRGGLPSLPSRHSSRTFSKIHKEIDCGVDKQRSVSATHHPDDTNPVRERLDTPSRFGLMYDMMGLDV